LPPDNYLTKFLKLMARSIAFREALREAMTEEMRRDDRVFLMGEEVAEYNGAYKVSQGMLAEFGPKRVIDTPISELGLHCSRRWSCAKWFKDRLWNI
jgi:hypothetical protein